eukprot:scaffold41772_cov33-Phaeocystis_antarctica.AAC.4
MSQKNATIISCPSTSRAPLKWGHQDIPARPRHRASKSQHVASCGQNDVMTDEEVPTLMSRVSFLV